MESGGTGNEVGQRQHENIARMSGMKRDAVRAEVPGETAGDIEHDDGANVISAWSVAGATDSTQHRSDIQRSVEELARGVSAPAMRSR